MNLRSVMHTAGGPAIYSVAQFVLMQLLTKVGGPSDLADFLLAQAVATPVALFAGMRTREQASTSSRGAARSALVHSLITAGVAGLVVGVGWMVFASGQQQSIGLAVLFANLAQQVLGYAQGVLERNRQFLTAGGFDLVMGASSLGCLALGVWLLGANWGVPTGIWLGAALWVGLACGGLLMVSTSPSDSPRTADSDGSTWSHDLKLGATAATQVGQLSIARMGTSYSVSHIGLARIGTASVMVRMGVIVVGAISKAIAPDLADASEAGELAPFIRSYFHKVLLFSAVVAILGAVAGMTFAVPLLGLLFSPESVAGRLTVAIVLAGAGPLYGSMLLMFALLSAGQSSAMMRSAMAGVIVTAITILPFGWGLGLVGAAVSATMGSIARLVVAAWTLDTWLRNPDQASPHSPAGSVTS